MKKEYISPFTNIIRTSISENMIACSPTNEKKDLFGNDADDPVTTPDVSTDLTDIEGDNWNTLSKRRNGFYE